MKVTNEQFKKAIRAYWAEQGGAEASIDAAIESLPEPLPLLRPLSEMLAEVPEGAVRLTGFLDDFSGEWRMVNTPSPYDKFFLDVLPPLPEPAKPDSLQDELVTALEKLEKATHLLDPSKPLQYAQAITLMRECAQAALAKVKGGQP